MFFASLMVLSMIYVFVSSSPRDRISQQLYSRYYYQFLVPETKQVPLERMHELFAPDVKAWNAHRVVMSRKVELPTVNNNRDEKGSVKESEVV